MRIVSMDGTLDMPYEDTVVQRRRNQIVAFLVGDEEMVKLANYLNESQAMAAMDRMHACYKDSLFAVFRFPQTETIGMIKSFKA